MRTRSLCLVALVLSASGWHSARPVAAGEPPDADFGNAVDFSAGYTAEAWTGRGAGGGWDEAYLDNLDVVLEADLEAAFGWRDTRAVVHGLYNNGGSFGGRYLADLQGVSNIETGIEAARIFEAFIERGFGEHASLLFGLYDLNSEFDTLETSSLFIHSAHGIGTDIAQTGLAGPSIFPVTSLAMRFEYRWTDRWLARIAVLDAVPGDPDHPSRSAIELDADEGALLAGEVERSFPSGRILAGAWRYTAAFTDQLPTARSGTLVEDRGNYGLYLRGEWRPRAAPFSTFIRLGWAAPRFNAIEWFASAGAVYEGLFPARPEDRIGVALAVAQTSDEYRRAVRLAGLGPVSRREVALELTYEMPLGGRFVLQPDVQYILDPGLDPAADGAWAIGLRLTAALFGPGRS